MKTTKVTSLFGTLFFANMAYCATVSDITPSACEEMKETGVISVSAPVDCSRLKNVKFPYVDFLGKEHQNGNIVVLDAVAPHVAKIFSALHDLKFPIHQANPMEFYKGDDEISMVNNNTSGFNYRPIADQKSLSLHAYGVAIDINPVQNPFLEFPPSKIVMVKPPGGINHINRMQYRFAKQKQTGKAEAGFKQ